jgi:hypothetical protein
MKMKSYLGKSQFGEFLRNRKNALAMTAEKENLNDAPLPTTSTRLDFSFPLVYCIIVTPVTVMEVAINEIL